MCRGCRKVVKSGWQVVRPWTLHGFPADTNQFMTGWGSTGINISDRTVLIGVSTFYVAVSNSDCRVYNDIPVVWGLSFGSAAAHLHRLRLLIPLGPWISMFCERSVLSGRGHCDGSITRPEGFYRVLFGCVFVFVCACACVRVCVCVCVCPCVSLSVMRCTIIPLKLQWVVTNVHAKK